MVKTGLGRTKNGKKTAGKDFLSKGAVFIVTTMLITSFLITIKQCNHKNKHTITTSIITMKQYNQKNKHTMRIVNYNETIQSQE